MTTTELRARHLWGLQIHSTGPDDTELVIATRGHGIWHRGVELQDLIFSNGFESGSTSSWSATVE